MDHIPLRIVKFGRKKFNARIRSMYTVNGKSYNGNLTKSKGTIKMGLLAWAFTLTLLIPGANNEVVKDTKEFAYSSLEACSDSRIQIMNEIASTDITYRVTMCYP